MVVTCFKNNDGKQGDRSALERNNGLFVPVNDFDFSDYDTGGVRREPKVREEHIREVFGHGRTQMTQKQAAERLQELAIVGRSAAYEALKLEGGRFSQLLERDPETHLMRLKGN